MQNAVPLRRAITFKTRRRFGPILAACFTSGLLGCIAGAIILSRLDPALPGRVAGSGHDAPAETSPPNECVHSVTRVTVARTVANTWWPRTDPDLPRFGRLVPALRDGKVEGFKLYGIRPLSPLATIGLRNGDTVLSIQGVELTSPHSALALYRQLVSDRPNPVVVDVRRDGCLTSLIITFA